LTITGIQENTTYRLLTVTGIFIDQGMLHQGTNTVSVQNISPGIYILEMTAIDGQRKNCKSRQAINTFPKKYNSQLSSKTKKCNKISAPPVFPAERLVINICTFLIKHHTAMLCIVNTQIKCSLCAKLAGSIHDGFELGFVALVTAYILEITGYAIVKSKQGALSRIHLLRVVALAIVICFVANVHKTSGKLV